MQYCTVQCCKYLLNMLPAECTYLRSRFSLSILLHVCQFYAKLLQNFLTSFAKLISPALQKAKGGIKISFSRSCLTKVNYSFSYFKQLSVEESKFKKDKLNNFSNHISYCNMYNFSIWIIKSICHTFEGHISEPLSYY